ncbi:MAG TPA: hypothetical protein VHE59_04860 [Mucilaginibacter sp.]|nr:hypothetical protein [Mucilaginibacter sp.]
MNLEKILNPFKVMLDKYVTENVWYLPSENTWKEFQYMAMKDIGKLIIESKGITFSGSKTNLFINRPVSITYGKQGRDFINKWVKIEYQDQQGDLMQAYFADGNNRGWSGIFGGTKKLHRLLLDLYLVE